MACFPHCQQDFMDDAIFKEGQIVQNKRLVLLGLIFDFTIVSFDGLIDREGVTVIYNIPLAHSLTFACCTKRTLLSLT